MALLRMESYLSDEKRVSITHLYYS